MTYKGDTLQNRDEGRRQLFRARGSKVSGRRPHGGGV